VDFDSLKQLIAALNARGVRYAIFGAVAMGLTARVVSPRTLYTMKKDTVRAKDRADAEMLRRAFDFGNE
jgi:hypothetical protein